ncbi:Mur ligase family protein [Brevibacterium aurantiacum]|uniref:UDP-N-acetylmuramoyl-tripeptide--D-alanyl-D-alanine ligase n=1 Tax=Brevibacterium aurantiacum TaxID=273384 RepID=A0A2H1J2B8_BREAU|nr:UDP-N-acetylmuramoyl-tripeptide--D-alanyl-D-alanine ligase [Brevibacterium aurantiacum]SMX81605.1 UDP-N-acetylmuramoyl-tripeptide--D-alanyl-D-alanine ligase [Brevibacterium aurantiacum]
MQISELLSLLPDDTAGDYRGDPGADFNGLTVRFSGKRVRGKFCVMLTESWGSAKAVKKYFSPEVSFAKHIASARRNGALGFVLPREFADDPAVAGTNAFFTDDTANFAFTATTAIRNSASAGRITAITGSAGKSTTKSMITHALKQLVPSEDIYSPGSTQNVEASILGHMSMNHRYPHSVLEIAGSAFHRFRRNGFAPSADVSIVTSISEAHLDYLSDTATVADIKSDIFRDPPPAGIAVINVDTLHSDILVRRAVRAGRQLVTYGQSEGATIRLRDYDIATGSVTAEIGDELLSYTVGARGRHMALNSLAVIATLRALGFRDWRRAVASLATFEALDGRGKSIELNVAGGVVTMIDESYNANPASMRAAIETFNDMRAGRSGRKIAVLGDILELGSEAESIHLSLVDLLEAAQFDQVHLVGEYMGAVGEALADRGVETAHWTNLDHLIAALRAGLRADDEMLFKSSNGTGVHLVVSALVGVESR